MAKIISRDRLALVLAPFSQVVAFLAPYAFVAEGFRGLHWVWESSYAPFWITGGFLLILAMAASLLLRGLSSLGLSLYQVGIFVSLVQPAWLAMQEKRHSLLLLVFLLFCAQVYFLERVKRILRMPYYDSRRRWWEGVPKSLPGLRAELLQANEDSTEVRVVNFGVDGCFVFSAEQAIPEQPVSVRVFRGDKLLLEAPVEVKRRTADGFGLGLAFVPGAESMDWIKDLEDYVLVLRRAGYDIANYS
jgi:hypothetical protein